MARLPIPGADNGTWGDLLNDYLSVEHNSNGTLKKAPDIASSVKKGDLIVNVRDYGAKGDSTTNDTAAFNAAIAAVTGATMTGTTGMVYIPPGTYVIEPIVLPNRTGLCGAGVGLTRLWRRNGGTTTGALIKNATHAHCCTVRDLMIDGKLVGDTTSHGLHLDNSAASDTDLTNGIAEYIDGRHYVTDLMIQNCQGTGLYHEGRGTTMVARVQSWINRAHGFVVGTDSFFTDCDAGAAGWDGFFIRGANSRVTACKAWYSGDTNTSAPGVAGGTGHGFHFINGSYSTCALIGCEAQDNKRAGFFMDNVGRHILQGCWADSNNRANLNHAGFEVINSFNNIVHGMAWDRGVNSNHQLSAARIQYGSNNRIEIAVSGTNNMAEPYMTNDSVINGNHVQINNQNGYLPVTYAASVTPNPYLGRYQAITLTGDISLVTPVYHHTSQQLTLVLTQDATGGRTASFDSGYTITRGGINPTPNATTVIDLMYLGGKWVQLAGSYAPMTGVQAGRPTSGEYLTPAMTGTGSVQLTTLNEVYYMPIDVVAATQIDALACNVTTGGTGTSQVIRLGLYKDSGTGRPTGSPIIDAGTADSTTTGVKTLTFTAITLTPGRYYVAAAVQGAITTGPTVVSASAINQIGLASLSNFSHRIWAQGSVAGAFGTVSSLGRVGTNPLLAARVV